MWKLITTAIDRAAMRSACSSVRPSPDGLHHGEEGLAFLSQPDFFAPRVDAAQVELVSRDSFRFATPTPSGYPENDVVRGRIERAGKDWQTRPSVILLHGWNAELQYRWLLPFWSELLRRQGVNAISFELPYHSSRRPQSPGSISNFLSGNLLHFLRAAHQTLAETRALAKWLRANGSPAVGVWGTSLGAWLTGLAISHQRDFDCAVLTTPVSQMDRALREMPFGDFMRGRAQEFGEAFSTLNLTSHKPQCRPENILVVSSRHDLFAPADTVDVLEDAWRPEVWRHAHGHITILVSARIMRQVAKWCAKRLNDVIANELETSRKCVSDGR
jgi:dienelactone hydrolase